MNSSLSPYINFKDQAREALDFYQTVLGGKVTVSTFGEFKASQDAEDQNKIMHGQLETPDGFTVMASDTPSFMEAGTLGGFSLALFGDDLEKLTQYFNGLSEGGTVVQPLTTSQWGDTFGMLMDKFGVTWMANISGPAE